MNSFVQSEPMQPQQMAPQLPPHQALVAAQLPLPVMAQQLHQLPLVNPLSSTSDFVVVNCAGNDKRVNEVSHATRAPVFASCSHDGRTFLRSGHSGDALASLAVQESAVWSVDLFPNGLNAVTASAGGAVRLWRTAVGGLSASSSANPFSLVAAFLHDGMTARQARFVPNSSHGASIACAVENTVLIYDANRPDAPPRASHTVADSSCTPGGARRAVTRLMAMPSSELLLAACEGEKRARLIDSRCMQEALTLSLPGHVRDFSLDPDTRLLTVATREPRDAKGPNLGGHVVILDVDGALRLVKDISLPDVQLESACLHPLATLVSSAETLQWAGEGASDAALESGGPHDFVLTGEQGSYHGPRRGVAKEDNSLTETNWVRRISLSTGAQLGEPLRRHHGAIYSVRFNPEGTSFTSAADDATVKLWSAASGCL